MNSMQNLLLLLISVAILIELAGASSSSARAKDKGKGKGKGKGNDQGQKLEMKCDYAILECEATSAYLSCLRENGCNIYAGKSETCDLASRYCRHTYEDCLRDLGLSVCVPPNPNQPPPTPSPTPFNALKEELKCKEDIENCKETASQYHSCVNSVCKNQNRNEVSSLPTPANSTADGATNVKRYECEAAYGECSYIVNECLQFFYSSDECRY